MTRKNLWNVFQWAMALAVLWLLVGYARRYWTEISAIEIHFNWLWLGPGLALVLLSNLIQVALFRYFLLHNGLPLGFFSAWRTYSLPQVGKYIPGKVTAVAVLSYMLKEAGLSLSHALAAVFVFNIVAVLSGLLMGLIMLPVWAPYVSGMTIWICLATALLAVPIVCTHAFWRIIDLALVRFKRTPLPNYPSRTAMTRMMVGWILYWFVLGSGMFAVTRLFIEIPFRLFPLLLAAFSLSCFISNVSLLTPAGLGIREALLVGIIGVSNTGFGLVFAAASRLAMLVDDIFMIGGAWLLAPKLGKRWDSQIQSIPPDSTAGQTREVGNLRRDA